ncbi:MAG: CCA tRNA nucleotidyltransferase [Beijerinckiaceae bacterium]|nr:CCA tRNA nucleotidyltransferase [Beijerinckiaceae bacterium]
MTLEALSARVRGLLAEPGALAILAAFAEAGEEARIIGGAVRNALLGTDFADIDLATTALPQRTMEIATDAGWKAVPTGIEHGTITIVIAGKPYEVTTLREDVATDGRHAEVRFGRDFRDDAARRDFTINAMAVSADGQLHDFFDGLTDLSARRVRFIGDPDQRLKEDYLRALRFLRFSAIYAEGPLDAPGLAACSRQREGFARLSRERIRAEMLKLIVAPRAVAVMQEAEAHGLLTDLVGLKPDLARFSEVIARKATPDALTRLFALYGDQAKAARDALRLSNRENVLLAALSGALALLEAGAPPKLVAYRFPDALSRLPALWPDITDWPEPPVFHLKGEDLLKAGLTAGPKIGATLKAIEARWIAAGFPTSQSEQLALMQAELEG